MTEALRLERAIGVPGYGAMALQALSTVAHRRGDLDLSARRAEEALAMFRAVGHASGAALALANLARVAAERGNDRQALAAYQEALRLWAGIGERWVIVRALAGLAALAAATTENRSRRRPWSAPSTPGWRRSGRPCFPATASSMTRRHRVRGPRSARSGMPPCGRPAGGYRCGRWPPSRPR